MKRLILLLACFALAVCAQPTHSVTLTWTDPYNPTGTTYNIYRQTGTCPTTPPTSTTGFTLLNTAPISGLTFIDTAVTVTTTYCYIATAVYMAAESVPSPDKGVTLLPFSPATLTISLK